MNTKLRAMPAVLLAVFLGLVRVSRAENEPAPGREPLVFEFLSCVGDASMRQELMVREGEPFRVVTRTNSERWTVFGRVGTIEDETVTQIKVRVAWPRRLCFSISPAHRRALRRHRLLCAHAAHRS